MAKKSKKSNQTQPIINRRARFDYTLGDELVVGLVLTGPQVRAARDHRVQIQGAFVKTNSQQELFLTGATFSIKTNGTETVSDTSDIKLLASKRQIRGLLEQKIRGSSIVPTKLLTTGRYIKLVIAIGKGKKLYDKREVIKARDLARERKHLVTSGSA
jgi:SsrA-binding protein